LHETWAAILQMLPNMSKEKAHLFIKNKDFSCPKTLYEIFRNNSNHMNISEQNVFLQNYFGANKNGTAKNHAKLSKNVFKMMTVKDSEELMLDHE
jgi:hypothetical protein